MEHLATSRRRLGLSARLGLTLSVVLTLSFALFGVAEWAGLRGALLERVDRTLALRAFNLVEEIREGDRLESSSLNQDPLTESSAPEVFVEILDPTGRVVAGSDNLRGARLSEADRLRTGEPRTVQAPGEPPLRMLKMEALRGGRPLGAVVVAEPLRLPLDWLARAGVQTAVLGLATLALAVAASAAVVRRGLLPLHQVAGTAEAIVRTGDVSRRVPAPGTGDAVGRVADSLNALLGRVESLLEADRRLLADTSHELRNPLTVLRTDLDLLSRELPEATRLEAAREATDEMERLIRLVDELLLLSRAESVGVQREPARLDAVVRKALARATPRAGERGIALETRALPAASVLGDPDRLRQVLDNLLENALNYTPPSGRVTVRLERGLPGWWTVEVEDTGIGIPEEHLPRVFDRFYRVDPSRSRASGGTGLGLTVARALVEAHGGRIGARSRPEGTCFRVDLPACEEQP